MNLSDPIADMLTRVRNATLARHSTVDVPYSKMKINIAEIFQAEGFIQSFETIGQGHKAMIRINLKYVDNKQPVLTHLKRVSRPGLRIYRGYKDIPRVRGGMGLWILSTPHGILSSKEAVRAQVGGEVLCEVW